MTSRPLPKDNLMSAPSNEKFASAPMNSHKTRVRRRPLLSVAVVFVALGVTSLASSQGKPKVKPGATPAVVTPTIGMLPPPDLTSKPAGAYSVLNEKGPGLPVVIAVNPWPATALSPIATTVASGAKPASSALGSVSSDSERALAELEKEFITYKKGAVAYSKAIGEIIRQRYEQKRKARLSSIQENIDRDLADLKKARVDTMERLKAFLAKYPDVAEHTPSAMFRLAALYEETAMEATDSPDPAKLKAVYEPAERLYRDVIAKFPAYSQRPSVQFFLGALLADTGRGPESQYVWRGLVCSNHYEYPLPPGKDEEAKKRFKEGIPPMPQDHDLAFWDRWRDAHFAGPVPVKKGRVVTGKKTKTPEVVVSSDTEDLYTDPYPEDCIPLGGALSSTGEESRYLSQAWWRIGEFHYDRGDELAEDDGYLGASPYRYNRALSAYTRAIKTSNETVKVFSMYKIAWSLYKHRRFNNAREAFMGLLDYFDDKEKKGATSGDAQMRQDAYDYIGATLTFENMLGPAANEAFYDSYEDPIDKATGKEREKLLEVAVDRVQDPKLVPQDKPWTVLVYKSLANKLEDDEAPLASIRLREVLLKKWDCDPEAPQTTDKISQLYDALAKRTESSGEREEYASKALEARTKLLNYVGTTKWTECNKSNPDAIRAAEALMSTGVKNAAGNHTALARQWLSKAKSSGDGTKEQREYLGKSREEYRLAERAWTAYLNRDPDATDSYESRFWVAESRHKVVVVTRLLSEPLDPKFVEAAREMAVSVRDSNLDDKLLSYAAFFAVDVYDKLKEEGYEAYSKSGCTGAGIEELFDPTQEPGDTCRPASERESREIRRIWVREMPATVTRTLRERDEYVAKVPAAMAGDQRLQFEMEVAEGLYKYGRWDEAVPRYEKIWNEQCTKHEFGWSAWYRLAVMSNLRGNSRRSVELVDAEKAKNCAMNEEQRLKEKNFAEPTKITALYDEAFAALEAAEKETDPKARVTKFREAAARFELALKAAPANPQAPKGAINAAYCYKQVNEYKKAAEVYRLFLDKYGKEDELIAYRDGDAKRGIKRDPDQFKTRLEYTKRALGELGRTYLQSFDYVNAAKHFEEVSNRTLLDEGERRDAAESAVVVHSNLGNREKMLAARVRYLAFKPGLAERADIDFVVAEFEFREWRQSPSDTAQKTRALGALEGYYNTYKAQSVAAKFVVSAAYDMSVIRKAAGEISFRDWYKKTIDAFDNWKRTAKDAVGSRESDYGAEAAYFFLNEKIEKEWDNVPGQPPKVKYEGEAKKVVAQLEVDSKKRDKYAEELENINKTYVSRRYFPIVLARQGSVFDTQRSALARSKVEIVDPVMAKKLKDSEEKARKVLDDPKASDDDKANAEGLLEKVDNIRTNLNKAWKDKRAEYYQVIEPPMIDRYARAYVRGKQFNVKDVAVTRAVQRLAYYTDQLDDTKMRGYLLGVEKDLPPFKYKDQMFKQARPGSISSPAPTVDLPTGYPVGAGAAKAE